MWTTEIPKQSGYYWIRETGESPEIVYLNAPNAGGRQELFKGGDEEDYFADEGGWEFWSERIQPPVEPPARDPEEFTISPCHMPR